jgi:S-adenosylmethionine:tRNA ribosyltransferase-isomerase
MSALDDWDYELPAGCIATHPAPERDGSRLLGVPRAGGELRDGWFRELPRLLRPGDLLVGNDSRVMAARLRARRASGGQVELLLLDPGPGPVRCLARPARRLKLGERLLLDGGGGALVVELADADGVMRVRTDPEPAEVMARQGEVPLPPYLGRSADAGDLARYQTVYSGPLGSSAAPTAGLHFTERLIGELQEVGVGMATVTLHVGLGTFRPLREEDLDRGRLHTEPVEVSPEVAERVARTRAEGGRIIAVGTTAARVLEARSTETGELLPGPGSTDLFIRPPYRFRVVDGLITNFHLPRSSLLMLVASLVSRQRLFEAYTTAIARGYRFYSYGDAMLLL